MGFKGFAENIRLPIDHQVGVDHQAPGNAGNHDFIMFFERELEDPVTSISGSIDYQVRGFAETYCSIWFPIFLSN